MKSISLRHMAVFTIRRMQMLPDFDLSCMVYPKRATWLCFMQSFCLFVDLVLTPLSFHYGVFRRDYPDL